MLSKGFMLKTIKIKRITEEIVSQIRDHIANGDFKAGDQLPSERDMAQQLGVGRPAVREALQVLEHTGFVEIIQGIGSFVKEIGKGTLTDPLQALLNGSDERYGEVYDFRIAIETWAVGQAAKQIKPDDLSRLRRILDRMRSSRNENEPVDELDTEFHLAIAQACKNGIYYHVVNTILHLLSRATRISHEELFQSDEDQNTLLEDHEAIFNAIKDRDADRACNLMRNHLDQVKQRITLNTRNLP